MIKRVRGGASGSAWSSRNGWFWFSIGGDIYSFMISLGRFSVTLEKKEK